MWYGVCGHSDTSFLFTSFLFPAGEVRESWTPTANRCGQGDSKELASASFLLSRRERLTSDAVSNSEVPARCGDLNGANYGRDGSTFAVRFCIRPP